MSKGKEEKKELRPVSEFVDQTPEIPTVAKASLLMRKTRSIEIGGESFEIKGIPLCLLPDLAKLLASAFSGLSGDQLKKIGEDVQTKGFKVAEMMDLITAIASVAPDFMGTFLRRRGEKERWESVGRDWVLEHDCTLGEMTELLDALIETSNLPQLIANFQNLARRFGSLGLDLVGTKQ